MPYRAAITISLLTEPSTARHPDLPILPPELIDIIIESFDFRDYESLLNFTLVNRHCMHTARKRMFSVQSCTLDSFDKCNLLKTIIQRTPSVANCIRHLRIRGGHHPESCPSEQSMTEDEPDEMRDLWLLGVFPVWRSLPNIERLELSFLCREFLAQWAYPITEFAFEFVTHLDLFHIEFENSLQFQIFISKFKHLSELTLSRISNEDNVIPAMDGTAPLPIQNPSLHIPSISTLTLRSTSYSTDWRLLTEWLINPAYDSRVRELWYLYDDNSYYSRYLGDVVAAVSHSVERLSLGFLWDGLLDNRRRPDELSHFDDDLRAIRAPHLRYLCLFGDLSSRAIMSILSLAPPGIEEVVFFCSSHTIKSWIYEIVALDVWDDLSSRRFSGLKKLIFNFWGRMDHINEAREQVERCLPQRQDVLEFMIGEICRDEDDPYDMPEILAPHVNMLR